MTYDLVRHISIPDRYRDFSKQDVVNDLSEIERFLCEIKGTKFGIDITIHKSGDSYTYKSEEFKEEWLPSDMLTKYDFHIYTIPSSKSYVALAFEHKTNQDAKDFKSIIVMAHGDMNIHEVETFLNRVQNHVAFYTEKAPEPKAEKQVQVSVTTSKDERKYQDKIGEKENRINWKLAILGGICAIIGGVLSTLVQHFIH